MRSGPHSLAGPGDQQAPANPEAGVTLRSEFPTGRPKDAQLLELTLDASVTPAGGSPGQPHDHRDDVLGERWTAASTVGLRPLAGHQAPVPPQDRARRHQEARPACAGKRLAQRREDRTIGGLELGVLHLAAQHAELVAQDRDLDVLACSLRKLPSSMPTSRRVMRYRKDKAIGRLSPTRVLAAQRTRPGF